MAKKRSSNQQLEQASRGELLSRLADFVVNPLDNDFGLDFQVTLTEQAEGDYQQVSSINFYIQLKASETFNGEMARLDLETDDLELYLKTSQPVVLAFYDDTADTFYWTVAQDYIWDTLEGENPGWRGQDHNRVKISKGNTFADMNAVRETVIASQKRIIRRQNMGLGIGEGIHFSSIDLSELDQEIESSLLSFKGHSLIKSQELLQQGETEAARETLVEVYTAPEKDEGKLKALIALAHTYSPVETEEALQIIALSEEAINLAQELKMEGLEYYTAISKHQAALFILLQKTTEILIPLTVHEGDSDPVFSYFFNERLAELLEEKVRIFGEINDILNDLIEGDHLYEYIVSLPVILDYISYQIMQLTSLKIMDRDQMEEQDIDHPLVEQCEQILDIVDDPEIQMLLGKSLGKYYHFTIEPEKAESRFKTAIEGAERLGDQKTVDVLNDLLEDTVERPYPYGTEVDEEDVENMTLTEYQELAKDMMELQGIDLERADDRTTEAIRLGVKDIDQTEYFRHCEHLRIRQRSVSPVGQWVGLNTLGPKTVWCKHGGAMESVNLELAFDGFKEQYCEGCEYHCPRPDNWEPDVIWWEEQAQDPELEEFLENQDDPWSPNSE